jgi:hypothetical protein
VLGTVLATVIAICAGISTTFVVGAACYLAAGVFGLRVSRRYQR